MSASGANTVHDTQLGLTSEEISLLRQAQSQAAAAGSSSSRAASRASSQGLLMVDPGSLATLARHLDHVMNRIQTQLEHLSEQAQVVTMQVYDHAGNIIDNADAEIARYNDIINQLDELEVDYDRIRNIRDIVRSFRQRADDLEREVDRSQSSSTSRREGHSSSKHGHGHSSHRHGHGGSSSGRHRH